MRRSFDECLASQPTTMIPLNNRSFMIATLRLRGGAGESQSNMKPTASPLNKNLKVTLHVGGHIKKRMPKDYDEFLTDVITRVQDLNEASRRHTSRTNNANDQNQNSAINVLLDVVGPQSNLDRNFNPMDLANVFYSPECLQTPQAFDAYLPAESIDNASITAVAGSSGAPSYNMQELQMDNMGGSSASGIGPICIIPSPENVPLSDFLNKIPCMISNIHKQYNKRQEIINEKDCNPDHDLGRRWNTPLNKHKGKGKGRGRNLELEMGQQINTQPRYKMTDPCSFDKE